MFVRSGKPMIFEKKKRQTFFVEQGIVVLFIDENVGSLKAETKVRRGDCQLLCRASHCFSV